MKKVLFMMLSMVMSLAAWSADGDVFTANTVEGVEMTFKVISESEKTCETMTEVQVTDNMTRYVTAIDRNYTGHVTIPSDINGYTVVSIGEASFYYTMASSFDIPNSVISIKENSFGGCVFQQITIPTGVKTIGNGAFNTCRELLFIDIPQSVESIGSGAFSGCRKLEEINMVEGSLRNLGAGVFQACSSLKNLYIPEGVTLIGEENQSNPFLFNNSSLQSVSLPSTLKTIEYPIFSRGLSKLESFFVKMEDPASVIVVDGLTDYSAEDIWENVVLYVPYSCKAAYQNAQYWNNFNNIEEIPAPVENITFADANVKDICVANWDTNGDGELSIDEAAAVADLGFVFYNNKSITTFNELQYFTGLNTISDNAFDNCNILTSVTIPNSVTSIGDEAFSGCSGLTSVTIGNSVTSIGNMAFSECSSLISITIPNSVTSIGQRAFAYCSGLTSITIPNSVTSIGREAFELCESLTTITIPNSVTSIGSYTFSGCSGLTSVTIGNSVTSIGEEAFSRCTSMTSITIPNSVTSIGVQAFGGCTSLTSVIIGNSVTSIGDYAFNGTAWFDAQPDGLVYAGLVAYKYKGTMPENTSITIKEGTKGIAVGAFYNCSGLTSVIITNSVSTIGERAFFRCSGLTSVTIPNSVTSIGSSAFNSCRGLTSVVSEVETPFTFGSDAFKNISANCTLTVPVGTKATYIAAGWTESVFQGGIVERSKQEQTLELATILTMTYGDDPYTLPQYTKEGLMLTWSIDAGTVATMRGNTLIIVGSGTAIVTATQDGNDDYMLFEQELTLTVNKAMLTITVDDCSKQEGEDNPELTVSYSGFKYDDDITSLTTQPTVTTTATTNSPAGTYPITVSGAESENYEFTYVDGTLTVTERMEPVVIDVTDISQIDNAIYIEPFTVCHGGIIPIIIKMKNAETATAYLFDMVLPEGITVAKNEQGKYIDALSDRHVDHTRTFNYKGDNTYSLSTLSGNSEALTGNDGAIRLVTLFVDGAMVQGTYAIEIKNASYSKLDGTLVQLPNTISSVTVEDYMMGDVNGNGGVDIGDAVSIVNYLVGKGSLTFVEKAADTNRNNIIDIGDAVTIVNYLVGKTDSLLRQTPEDGNEHEPQ